MGLAGKPEGGGCVATPGLFPGLPGLPGLPVLPGLPGLTHVSDTAGMLAGPQPLLALE